MTKLLFLAGLIFFNSTLAPATANLLDESFNTPAGSGPGGLGYDNTWTEVSGAALLNENSTTCGSGVGWAGECLRLNLTAFDDPKATSAFAAQAGDLYLTISFKLTYTIDTDAERWGIVALDDSVDETGGPSISIARSAGPVYTLNLYSGSMGVLDTYSLSSGSQVCLQLKMNAATDDWEWRIGDGTTQNVEGSALGTGAFTVDPTTLHIGTTTVQGGNTIDFQADNVRVGNNGWLACQ